MIYFLGDEKQNFDFKEVRNLIEGKICTHIMFVSKINSRKPYLFRQTYMVHTDTVVLILFIEKYTISI